MKTTRNKLLALISPIALVLLVAAFASNAMNYPSQDHTALGQQSDTIAAPQFSTKENPRPTIKLAQTHADICMANYTNCMNGCQGAQSCSNQCQINYQGCMNAGG